MKTIRLICSPFINDEDEERKKKFMCQLVCDKCPQESTADTMKYLVSWIDETISTIDHSVVHLMSFIRSSEIIARRDNFYSFHERLQVN